MRSHAGAWEQEKWFRGLSHVGWVSFFCGVTQPTILIILNPMKYRRAYIKLDHQVFRLTVVIGFFL